jgi:hypothetical protein
MATPVHVVTNTSPPRYFVHGAESDGDDIEEVRYEKTQQIAQELLSDTTHTKWHSLFIDLSFVPPVDREKNIPLQTVHQQLKPTGYSPDTNSLNFSWESPDKKHFVTFSAGYQKRWSILSVFFKKDEEKLLLRRHNDYVFAQDDTSLISLDTNARIFAECLSDSHRKSLGLPTSKTRKNLFPEGDDAISRTKREDRLEYGVLCAVKKIQIQIPLDPIASTE